MRKHALLLLLAGIPALFLTRSFAAAPPALLSGNPYCVPSIPLLPDPDCPNLDADCALAAQNEYYDLVTSGRQAACAAWDAGWEAWDAQRINIQHAFEDCIHDAAVAGEDDSECYDLEVAATAANNRAWGAKKRKIENDLQEILQAAQMNYDNAIAACCGEDRGGGGE